MSRAGLGCVYTQKVDDHMYFLLKLTRVKALSDKNFEFTLIVNKNADHLGSLNFLCRHDLFPSRANGSTVDYALSLIYFIVNYGYLMY